MNEELHDPEDMLEAFGEIVYAGVKVIFACVAVLALWMALK